MNNENEELEIDEIEIPEIDDDFDFSDEVVAGENNETQIEDVLDEPEIDLEAPDEEIVDEKDDKHRFDYLLLLNETELISEIRKIESEKPFFNFSKVNSKKLIEDNNEEVDIKTVKLFDWGEMKHFAVIDVKKSIFTYPVYDESVEYKEYNKTKYIPPLGFEFLDCSIELKPLGIVIVNIRTGRKKLNSRDMRFVGENVKRVEEIFVYNFEDQYWFKAKNNNEDYKRRLQITSYIEYVYRSYLPKFFETMDSLKKVEFYNSSSNNGDVLNTFRLIRTQLDELFRNSLFVLLFYNEIDGQLYEFYNLEVDNLVSRLNKCIDYLKYLEEDEFFIYTKTFNVEAKEQIKKLNDYVDVTSALLRHFLGNVSLKRLNEAFLKNNTSIQLHQKNDFKDMIKNGFYLSPSKTTLNNIKTVYGAYQPLPTLGQALNNLSKTDFPMSEQTSEYIRNEINEFLDLYTKETNQKPSNN